MDEQRAGRGIRITLMVATGFVAATAFAGGIALVMGSLAPDLATVLSPPPDYLEGSPFGSYLVPGLVLALVLGGVHLVAFVLLARRHPRALLAAVVAGYAAVIWIVVQMTIIPFSVLQAVYVAMGLVEIGLVLLALGILRPGRAGSVTPAR
jgi:hypothetical protein